MDEYKEEISKLVIRLFEIEALKFGNFKMKIGAMSPVYFDLRVIVSYPEIMKSVSDLLHKTAVKHIQCEHLCGVPYTALPIASVISVNFGIPMLIRRKEAKGYGTKKLIEGHFKEGDRCVIIEDVVTSGSSIIETVKDLKEQGLNVTDAVIILDRQQGGSANLKNQNINMKALVTLMDVINILVDAGKIEESMKNMVKNYLETNQFSYQEVKKPNERLTMPFEARQNLAVNKVAKKLFGLMCEKRTNLCVAADLTSASKILELFEKIAPYVCLFKTHIDIIEDFNEEFINRLVSMAKKHNVLLMEDRKFGDIGNTVALQYAKMKQWADLVTVHAAPGPGVFKGILSQIGDLERGIFIVAEMSSEGNLLVSQYASAAVNMASENTDLVAGLVCQNSELTPPGLIQLTPGVQLDASSDGLGQNYNSPEEVVMNKGADVAVVGRGIISSSDPANSAKIYRDRLWQAYEKRLQK